MCLYNKGIFDCGGENGNLMVQKYGIWLKEVRYMIVS